MYTNSLKNILLSQGRVLEVAPSTGIMDRMHIPRTEEEGKKPLIVWVQLTSSP